MQYLHCRPTSTFKLLILVALSIFVFNYSSNGTSHELTVPQSVEGNYVVRINDSELEDKVNNFFKIPLKFFPRQICLVNKNVVTSDGVAINRKEIPGTGDMNLYIEKDHVQLVDPIKVAVGDKKCRLIDIKKLEGATTTASYMEAAISKYVINPDGTVGVIGAHYVNEGVLQANIRTDVTKTHLWVGLSNQGLMLLFLFSFLGVSALALAVVELLKRIIIYIKEDNFL